MASIAQLNMVQNVFRDDCGKATRSTPHRCGLLSGSGAIGPGTLRQVWGELAEFFGDSARQAARFT
jgi:hypothetical protein